MLNVKTALICFLTFFSFICYSQDDLVEIKLKSDTTIYTSWLKLNGFPTMQKPFIRIDHPRGKTFEINEINSYKGYDQAGNFRNFQTRKTGLFDSFLFTERLFRQDSLPSVSIFYERLTFGGFRFPETEETFQYKLNNSEIKNLTYSNVKEDFADNKYASKYFKKAQQIRILQYLSAGIGISLIAKGIIDSSYPFNENSISEKDDFSLVIGSICLVFPITLQKPKREKLLKTVKNYRE
jgi:hypothetical protein